MKLFTDSCSDILLKDAKEMNVQIIPLTVHIDDKSYKDQVDITSEEILQQIKEGIRPITSQVNPETFIQYFKEALTEDNELLYIAFSSALSGTFQSALIAKQAIEDELDNVKINVIDTKAASYGQGLIVERAAKLMNDGGSYEDVIARVEDDIKNIRHLFTVSDLNFLAEGGRLSKGQAFLGSLLNIKPLLHIEDGKLVPIEKHRSSKKFIKSVVSKVNSNPVYKRGHISYTNNLKDATRLKELLLNETELEEITMSVIGPTISSHTGNGTLALFYIEGAK